MANPLREAILSLLAIRPMAGYDVRRTYQRAMQQIWYAPIGQVYPTLRAMHAEGSLESEVRIQYDRPNRKEYRLSETGERELAAWLERPAALPRMHHEFIHKLFLLDRLAPERRVCFVEEYVETCTAWAEQLAAIDAKFSSTPHGNYSESAACQLLALRHLRRLVDCEVASARDILTHIRTTFGEARRRGAKRRDSAPALTDLMMVAVEYSGSKEARPTGTEP